MRRFKYSSVTLAEIYIAGPTKSQLQLQLLARRRLTPSSTPYSPTALLVLLAHVEQVRPGCSKIDDLRTPVPVLF